ncbi:hypothetical protein [Shewanella sp. GXUN23E]|uniref:hypothetical protein n=1 Tax=Shewanella sp. GXUN23E TaxID=3422498 RepID=UPI003D7C8E46
MICKSAACGLTLVLSLTISLSWGNALADDRTGFSPAEWQQKDEAFKNWCQQGKNVGQSVYFPDVRTQAMALRQAFCNGNIDQPLTLNQDIVGLLGALERYLPQSTIPATLYAEQLAWVQEGRMASLFKTKTTPQLSVEAGDSGKLPIQGGTLSACNQMAANAARGDCADALADFKRLYNFAQATAAQSDAFLVADRLKTLEQNWNQFFEESKSQTIWELAVNGALFQDEVKANEFAPPPDWQLVLLHPTVVIEDVRGALDGDQLKEALMVEVIGADWWQQDDWYLPSGASLVATYSDRSGVDDWGYGLALHFDSKFTLGASNHGGDVGVFITVDLLKLLQSKQSTLESYLK